jgi:hypothetical protein
MITKASWGAEMAAKMLKLTYSEIMTTSGAHISSKLLYVIAHWLLPS